MDREGFSFFTGWPKERAGQHISFVLSYKDGSVHVQNLSESMCLIPIDKGAYNIDVGGQIKPFLRVHVDGSLQIQTPFASHPFFTWDDGRGGTIVTDSYNLYLRYRDDAKLNKQYLALRLKGEVAGLHLPFIDTRLLFPSFVYRYDAKGLKANNILFKIEEQGASIARAFDQADAIYSDFCAQKSHVVASLTGGYDSRFYSCMLRRHLKKDRLDFFYVGDYEAHLCASVAKTLDAKFTAFSAPSTVEWLRQQPISFYGGDDFFRASNGLWREEGLYLYNATACAAHTILGELDDDVGFMGMCIESANKGSGYEQGPDIEKAFDRMYVERHPDLGKFRSAVPYAPLRAPVLEDVYADEIDIIQNATDRKDILVDLQAYYFTTFPKTILRNGVYGKSGRVYFPLMDERFFNAYLGAPASDKADIGFYRHGFESVNKKLLSLPHRSMDTLKAGMNVTSAGSYWDKFNHKLRIRLGLAKKYKGPKNRWKNVQTEKLLGPLAHQYFELLLPEIDKDAFAHMYYFEVYSTGEYMQFLDRQKKVLATT